MRFVAETIRSVPRPTIEIGIRARKPVEENAAAPRAWNSSE